jgi:hypothetical protein
MSDTILLYDNAADEGTLSAGSWAIPLTEMQDARPTTKARSTNLDPASTIFRIALTESKTFRAIVFGPTNLSSGSTYRIRSYSDSGFIDLADDTGAVTLGSTPIATLDMHWTDTFWWSGATPIEDPGGAAGGVWVIHIYESDVTAKFWQFDIDNQSNPDGYVEIGRLFMGTAWIPSNGIDEGAAASFTPITTSQQAAGGTRYYNRRRAARTFTFACSVLPADEANEDVYRISAISGLDKQVFIIPNADDSVAQLSRRSILGNLSEMPSWAFTVGMESGIASTSFKIVEAI